MNSAASMWPIGILVVATLLLLSSVPSALGYLNCSFVASSSCGASTIKLLGVANDTGGWNNSHGQNVSVGTYANSLCCNSTTVAVSAFNTSCGGAATTWLRLADTDNAHAQQANESTYNTSMCFSAALATVSIQYNNTACSTGYGCMLSLANTAEGSNSTNAHIGDCDAYTRKVCGSVSNSAPSVPTLLIPLNNNYTVSSRYPTFNWTNVSDPDGDAVTYQWNITSPSGCAAIPLKNSSSAYYLSIDKLCVDRAYNWTVRACDTSNTCSAYATQFNFSIPSVVGITFTTGATDFGSLVPSDPTANRTNDTLSSSPAPLVYNNSGNVDVLTSAKANAALWVSQALSTSYFQYADENSSAWINVTSGYTSLTSNLTLGALREFELKVWVPQGETQGAKNTTLTVLGASLE